MPGSIVLEWNGKANNPVEAEYILMSETKGTPLWKAWHNIELYSKLNIVDEIVPIESKLLSLSFTQSVYSSANI